MTQPVHLETLREITNGDPELERELFALFFQTIEACLARMAAAAGAMEWSESAHEMKGAAANIGAPALVELCLLAEKAGEERQRLLAQLAEEYARVKAFLQTEQP